jgi:tetratricopeptide (TPR) repeat protein
LLKKTYPTAIRELTEAIRYDSQNPNAWENRGNTYYAMKRYDDAIKDYSQAIKLAPHLGRMYGSRANAYEKSGKTELAAKDRKQATVAGADWADASR